MAIIKIENSSKNIKPRINLNHNFNNFIAKMEVGCLKYPGASTIGSQLLDEDCSHGWQILAAQPWAPTQQQEQAPVTL